ncbi:MAG TPA: hypothetical protein VGL93_03905 [Streptosporangiaceae bacterium]|jgi:hypothetical protein
MSLANKVAGAARAAVDNARKTADQALHDPAALRDRIRTQVRDLPMTAVQFTVKGVGQALQLGDRVRQELGHVRESGIGGLASRIHGGDERTEGAEPAAPPAPAARSPFEEAGRTDTAPADEPLPEGVRPARKARSARKPAGGDSTVVPIKPPADLPIPDYDERTVPSLRARLRNLSADDVRRLLEYERAHAARDEVIGMFERRMTKITEG